MQKNLSDLELLKRLKKGEALSLDEIFNRYWESLYRLAFNVVQDHAIAQDLVQEVFISLWERRHRLIISDLKAFLHRAVRNQLANHIRNSKKLVQYEKRFETIRLFNEIEAQINAEDLQQTINQKIKHLPLRCREIFRMSRYEYRTNREIAEQLKISVKTVEVQLSRALSFLRNSL